VVEWLMMTSTAEKAATFRSLHVKGSPLLLPNAWDVASARVVEAAGAAAVATTSAGVAWSLGAADGDRLDRDRLTDLVARIVAAVDVPVSVDIETGYADDPGGVAETVRSMVEAGAVGVNLEDGWHGGREPLRSVTAQCERLAAARGAADTGGPAFFLNARTDVYMGGVADPAARLAEALDRATAYLAAGADGIFVPGVVDFEVVAKLAGELTAPLNVLGGPHASSVAELARAGVARISLGPFVAEAAYAVAKRVTEELLGSGGYASLAGALSYGELNGLLAGGPAEAAR
jgi:2-methylisocitrate lyase-like PEP mutase family enzyme